MGAKAVICIHKTTNSSFPGNDEERGSQAQEKIAVEMWLLAINCK